MTTAIYGNSLYVISPGPTWEEAEANANLYGGHLAEINSQDENDFLYQTYGIGFWIGLNDLDQEGVYVWSTGRTLEETGYENWHDGEVLPPQPNNFSFYEQDYVWFHPNMSGDWDDQHWQYPGDGDTTGVISFNPEAYGIAEIPLNLSTDLPESVEEGTEFTVDINLTTSTTGSELTQGSTIWYTYEITGVDDNGDPDLYSGTGSGLIDVNGQFDDEDGVLGLQVTIDKDWVFDDDLFRLTFYSDDPSGTGSELGFTDPAAYRDTIQIDIDQEEGS